MAWTFEERKQFFKILTALAEIYGRKLSMTAQDLYLRALEKHPFQAVKKACEMYLSNASGRASYFPRPGDLIALIDGNPEDRASQAWAEVLEALRRIGVYASVRFRDPITNACIAKLGGWTRLGKLDDKTAEWLGNEFRRLYRNFYQTGKVPKVDHLPGLVETENSAKGFTEFIPPIVEVGSELSAPVDIVLIEQSDFLKPIQTFRPTSGSKAFQAETGYSNRSLPESRFEKAAQKEA